MNHNGMDQGFPTVSRRGFLAAGGAGVVGLSLHDALAARASTTNGAVIQIVLNGGASHLETFDPKPHAPREIRGPLHSIATRIPDVRFSECLPRLADRADQLVILRSLCHQAAPIHEVGLQQLLTGQLVKRQVNPPHVGIILQRLLRGRRKAPVSMQLGGYVAGTGTSAYRGDGAGTLSPEGGPERLITDSDGSSDASSAFQFSLAPRHVKEAYGASRLGELLWKAARQVERGVRYVAVNTFDRLEGALTWDAHGCPEVGPATVFDYRDALGPQFDQALSALLDDLRQTGLWTNTLIVCTGEMGRTPRLNANGGRDHWTQAWSGILAGGMLQGGQVIGQTDEHGEAVLDTPINVCQLPALILEFMGIAPGTEIVQKNGKTFKTPEAVSIFS